MSGLTFTASSMCPVDESRHNWLCVKIIVLPCVLFVPPRARRRCWSWKTYDPRTSLITPARCLSATCATLTTSRSLSDSRMPHVSSLSSVSNMRLKCCMLKLAHAFTMLQPLPSMSLTFALFFSFSVIFPSQLIFFFLRLLTASLLRKLSLSVSLIVRRSPILTRGGNSVLLFSSCFLISFNILNI